METNKTYYCPYCRTRIKKGANNCPHCEKPIAWIPVTNEASSVSTIVSRGKMGQRTITNKQVLDQLYQKLFLQMYEVVKKSWKVSKNSSGEYVATLDILVGEPQNLPAPEPVQVVRKQVIQGSVNQPQPVRSAPKVATSESYDKMVAQQPQHPYHRPDPKPEFLEFQQRLKQSTMQVPSQMQTVNDNGDFTQNIF